MSGSEAFRTFARTSLFFPECPGSLAFILPERNRKSSKFFAAHQTIGKEQLSSSACDIQSTNIERSDGLGGRGTMRTTRQWRSWYAAGLSMALAGLTGCQTWVPTAGLTLPSGHYLQHRVQFFPQSPDFPLTRELATMESQAAVAPPPAGAVPIPAPPPPPPPGP